MLRDTVVVVLWLGITAQAALAQGTRADYERAERLGKEVRASVPRTTVDPVWLSGDRVAYERVSTSGQTEILVVECTTGRAETLVDPESHQVLLQDLVSSHPVDDFEVVGTHIDPERGAFLLFVAAARAHVARFSQPGIPQIVDIAEDHPFNLEPDPRRRGRRGRSRGRVDVLFSNETDQRVSIEWLQSEAERRAYATIEPRSVHRQGTIPGHAWAVVDEAGEDLVRFVAGDGPGLARIVGRDRGASRPRRTESPRRRRENEEARRAWRIELREHDLHAIHRDSGEERRLTSDGTAEAPYRDRLVWSPDGHHAIATRRQPGQDREVTIVESSPRDQVQPKVHTYSYPKPGDSLTIDWPVLLDLHQGTVRPIATDLFDNPFNLGRYHWDQDNRHFTFVYNQRGHQLLRVLEVDVESATPRVLLEERSETFIDYSSKMFVHFLEATGEIVWASERDGWNHLYLVDRETGEVKNQITRGEWVVREVVEVDEEERTVWLKVRGVHPGQDPYHIHFARVGLDGGEMTLLTEADGTHTASLSPDHRWLVATWSRVDHATVIELRDARTGELVQELARASLDDWSRHGVPLPQRFVSKGRDGETDIHGVIYRPSNLDPDRRYPVIESIYAGPHGQHVPKRFAAWRSQQALAEIGFIVVQIDGMGTNWRSKAFHDVAWKNLGDAGFPDRIAWLRAASAAHPEIDLDRVGIYGGSAGGQNAMRGLLDHPDFYKVGVADCGCHDNRMDKIWWNEAWMGWPVDESYVSSSNVEDAHKLEGKLLLTVGELDRNVDPASTMQVVDALIRADKDFDLIVFPGAGHGAGGSPYGVRRMRDFFVRHLWGREPRAE